MPPASGKIRVLVVDDSALMRQLIARELGSRPGIEVAGTARNGKEALEKTAALAPDVVTLDVEMPVMDGIEALRRIMREFPRPVIMFSSHTTEGARSTVEALSLGAVDFVTKPARREDFPRLVEELAAKVRAAAAVSAAGAARAARASETRAAPPAGVLAPAARGTARARLVVIGCSTGGPSALQAVVPALPAGFPASVVVVQHIPVGFSGPLAEHLAKKSVLPVKHAENGDPLEPGRVLVAPAGLDLTFSDGPSGARVSLSPGKAPLPPGGFRPSVDGVMTSAARTFGPAVVGVLMTGMGRDGAAGMAEIKRAGGRTIAEAESTCVVFGMPRAAIEAGAADRVVPLYQIAAEIQAAVVK